MRFRAAPFFVLPHQPIRWSAHTVFFILFTWKIHCCCLQLFAHFHFEIQRKCIFLQSVRFIICFVGSAGSGWRLVRCHLQSTFWPVMNWTTHFESTPKWTERILRIFTTLTLVISATKNVGDKFQVMAKNTRAHTHNEQINLIKPRESQKVTLFVVDIAGCVSSQNGDAEL